MSKDNFLSGTEQFFDRDEIIVSKTNLKGHITYANRVFLKIAGYSEKEVLGKPHSFIRHPDMPRCIFKMLWDTIGAGREVFAYVLNRCKNGDHYWVYAHVTPSRDMNGQIIGYHSNRRVPDRHILDETIIPLYEKLKAVEQEHRNSKKGLEASYEIVQDMLTGLKLDYNEYIMTVGQNERRGYR